MKHFLLIIILLTSVGCTSIEYRSQIDRKQYAYGLRSLTIDGRDDVKACTFYMNVAGYVMRSRQYDGDDYYRLRAAVEQEFQIFRDEAVKHFPNEEAAIEQVVFMMRDMLRVLITEATSIRVAGTHGKDLEIHLFQHKQRNMCLLTTTLSRSMNTAERLMKSTTVDFEGVAARHYDKSLTQPKDIPNDTKPINEQMEMIQEKTISIAIDLLKWYLRM